MEITINKTVMPQSVKCCNCSKQATLEDYDQEQATILKQNGWHTQSGHCCDCPMCHQVVTRSQTAWIAPNLMEHHAGCVLQSAQVKQLFGQAEKGSENDDFSTTTESPGRNLRNGKEMDWKDSLEAVEVIRRGQAMDKHIHIGRVNWYRRFKIFQVLKGSEHFTFDGTRTRFDGTEKTIRAWQQYQLQPPLVTI